MNELGRWANFYLLISAAAATLIGLLFVVISLGADRIVEDRTANIRMYLTPTVIYFASALFLLRSWLSRTTLGTRPLFAFASCVSLA